MRGVGCDRCGRFAGDKAIHIKILAADIVDGQEQEDKVLLEADLDQHCYDMLVRWLTAKKFLGKGQVSRGRPRGRRKAKADKTARKPVTQKSAQKTASAEVQRTVNGTPVPPKPVVPPEPRRKVPQV